MRRLGHTQGKMTMYKLDIAQLRKELEVQRKEVTRFLEQLKEETRSLDVGTTEDAGDRCVSSMSKEFLFEQSSQRRTVLRRIEAALRRMDNGSFGICAGCGDEIPARRLQALPWTQFCLRCQEAIEEESAPNVSPRSFSVPTADRIRTG
jgi:DnaK suppressor protein